MTRDAPPPSASDALATGQAVLVISSQVARGAVGLRAAGFALERIGVPVWKVPTVWLPWHPGHMARFGVPPRIPAPDDAFAASLSALVAAPFAGELAAVLTGYFATAGQVMAACAAIDAARARVAGLKVIVDPVSADAGGRYVPDAVIAALREHLLPRADLATPNRFELALFTGQEPGADAPALGAQARALGQACGVPRLVVTSAQGMMRGHTGTLLVDADRAVLAEHALLPGAPNGTGDLFAALLAGRLVQGADTEDAVAAATASVFEMVARTVRAGGDELAMVREQDSLVRPMAQVTRRRLALPAPAARPAAAQTLAGVDGCRAGWVAVTGRAGDAVRLSVHRSFADLFAALPADALVAVDMPIGLPDRIEGGGRAPERLVRPMLAGRQSSVFAMPGRAAVEAGARITGAMAHDIALHQEACALARGLSQPPRGVSIQGFRLFPKVLEIDALLRADPALAARVHESHPEVAFAVLNGGTPMATPKKTKGRVNPDGLAERLALLARHGVDAPFLSAPPPPGVGADDVVDAAACWLVARRIAAGEAVSFPDPPERDRHGLPVAIRA